MRQAGAIVARVLAALSESVRAGMATRQLDVLAQELTDREHAQAAFKGYRGYPASVCVSINEEIVHGIPGERIIQDGDIVSLDYGCMYRGYFADAALTVPVGKVDAKHQKLIAVTKQALDEGISQARVSHKLSDISWTVQQCVERNGFSVVRHFVGHGIGRNLHEEPEIPNWGQKNKGPSLQAGMCLAIEPMVNAGTWDCRIMENGWTAVTADGRASAHFEHTVAVTEEGPLVLTRV